VQKSLPISRVLRYLDLSLSSICSSMVRICWARESFGSGNGVMLGADGGTDEAELRGAGMFVVEAV
jgi:hypothetical protein